MIHAGGLDLANPLCLAPLAGITTLPVRELFSGLGAALTHTEMISCAGLVRDNAKTLDMLQVSERESPLVVQLFASSEKILCEGASKVLESCKRFAALGVNMACPMPKITRNGSGSALLRKPDEAFNMIKGLKTLSPLPVWVKIRKLDDYDLTLHFIEKIIKAGADNVCIHGRTPAQRYEGVADREIIRLAAKNFAGYISASGDVRTLDDIHEYLDMNCMCVMLARGAFANAWLFEEFRGIFKGTAKKLDDLINFAYLTKDFAGEHKSVVLLKRFAGNMIKATHGAAELRKLAMLSQNLEELIEILKGAIF
ncbi:MAG: tRNA-dihydrouridine synthase family protein [Synergistaceae bacterium]|nr:tRNA-dihydrouridine synthase family protein [Synergistaceae bacterium]